MFGSQTGNSEEAARTICNGIPTKLASPTQIQKLTGCSDEDASNCVQVVPKRMQLDDFLELDHCKWSRLVIIVTSSYGVGMAPLGCYRFRELCDAWWDQYGNTDDDNNNSSKILDGLQFALCGLGDSKFTTFFQNPQKINDTLGLLGAKRVGSLGKADASGMGDDEQELAIEKWIDGIWPELAKAVLSISSNTSSSNRLSDERLSEMQAATVEVCQRINPDFVGTSGSSSGSMFSSPLFLSLLVIILAIAAYHVMQK